MHTSTKQSLKILWRPDCIIKHLYNERCTAVHRHFLEFQRFGLKKMIHWKVAPIKNIAGKYRNFYNVSFTTIRCMQAESCMKIGTLFLFTFDPHPTLIHHLHIRSPPHTHSPPSHSIPTPHPFTTLWLK